ncbi:MAG: tRNA uridine-5-carboxymethylaminomethyl(34) synthesis enzyme MnmG, partial [Candidatus Baumannia cicadellinicola]|nr:tRNA uridine-5-carboxymethylaminomethyl(34) synthesis enzyme MnmG [Candidatus Baumannia cicadellinicola]
AQQQEQILRQLNYEQTLLPKNMDFSLVTGLSNEAISQLNNHQPYSIGQALRISGITPIAISLLLLWLKKNNLLANKINK